MAQGLLYQRITAASASPAVENADRYKMELYSDLSETLRKAKQEALRSGVKVELARINGQIAVTEQLGDAMTRLRESAGKDKRTAMEAAASIEVAITKAEEHLASRALEPNGTALQGWVNASATGDYAEGLRVLAGSFLDPGGIGENDLTLPATLDDVKRTLFPDVVDLDTVSLLDWAQKNGVPQETLSRLERLESSAHKTQERRTTGRRDLSAMLSDIRGKQEALRALPEGADATGILMPVVDQWQKQLATTQGLLTGGDKGALVSKVQELESGQRQIADLEANVETLGADLFSGGNGQGAREQVASIIGDPRFRTWAEQYGLSLGEAEFQNGKLVRYAPGPDDEKAIILAHKQMRRKNPLIAPKTNRLVELEITRQAPDAAIYQHPELGGKYVQQRDAQGNVKYLTPDEAQEALAEAQRAGAAAFEAPVETAFDDRTGRAWFKTGSSVGYYDLSNGTWNDVGDVRSPFTGGHLTDPSVREMQAIPPDLAWAPAALKDPDADGSGPGFVPVSYRDIQEMLSTAADPAQGASYLESIESLDGDEVLQLGDTAWQSALAKSGITITDEAPTVKEVKRGREMATRYGDVDKKQYNLLTEQGREHIGEEEGATYSYKAVGDAGQKPLAPPLRTGLAKSVGGRGEAMANQAAAAGGGQSTAMAAGQGLLGVPMLGGAATGIPGQAAPGAADAWKASQKGAPRLQLTGVDEAAEAVAPVEAPAAAAPSAPPAAPAAETAPPTAAAPAAPPTASNLSTSAKTPTSMTPTATMASALRKRREEAKKAEAGDSDVEASLRA